MTLYYRAPEIVIGHDYDHKSDMWSFGCIFAELLNNGKPILPGKSDENQFELICNLIGFPTGETWPAFFSEKTKDLARLRWYTFYKDNKLKDRFSNLTEAGLDFLSNLLIWDPKVRDSHSDHLRSECPPRELSCILSSMRSLCQRCLSKSQRSRSWSTIRKSCVK